MLGEDLPPSADPENEWGPHLKVQMQSQGNNVLCCGALWVPILTILTPYGYPESQGWILMYTSSQRNTLWACWSAIFSEAFLTLPMLALKWQNMVLLGNHFNPINSWQGLQRVYVYFPFPVTWTFMNIMNVCLFWQWVRGRVAGWSPKVSVLRLRCSEQKESHCIYTRD